MKSLLYNDKLQDLMKPFFLVFYLFVNSLFVLKYVPFNSFFSISTYVILLIGVLYLYLNIKVSQRVYKILFWVVAFMFFLFTIFVNYYVDGTSLNVDRWSAMEVGVKAIMHNQYPYNIPDHMGQESSNLPILVIIGMPFYLLFGSVGYLQSFTFLLMTYFVFKKITTYQYRLLALFLLILSPSYLWEIYTKSDLFSNFIIILGFALMVMNEEIGDKKVKWVSIWAGLLLMTRISAIIPLLILVLQPFFKLLSKQKIKFILISCITVFIVLFFFFRNAADLEMIKNHNPILIQRLKQPFILSVLYIVIASLLSFYTKNLHEKLAAAAGLLFIMILVLFVMSLVQYGFVNCIENSYFDLSFFNMSMPFIIFVLAITYNSRKSILR
mgnify:FL=1